ncbi:ArsR/SmtB family transcription factor [Rhodococcus wratislaviensis]|uniref:Putative ArsR family transcriptional regulator n=1 Tax=Rhodococcus wratislaviensis NBRC 100605 TaxID=1219028 RepID=X0PW82_RHOWR|nr:metalloregulator ArsR/SmtB family transcription factor [Rhodococcus wratislaviensis]GAF42497.1 putative ArsR family transcriptional regulator [Rhodococcus wratislaviensis NBRC 100605]
MTEERVDTCDLLCLDLPHAEQIRATLPPLRQVEPAAAAARALSDPTRLTIATALYSGGELCVCDMAWVVGQAQNLVSHHLRQLKIADLVSSRRHGRLVMYALTDRGHGLVRAVLGDELASATTGPENSNDIADVSRG